MFRLQERAIVVVLLGAELTFSSFFSELLLFKRLQYQRRRGNDG